MSRLKSSNSGRSQGSATMRQLGAGGRRSLGMTPATRTTSGMTKINTLKVGTMGAYNKPKITNNFVHQGGITTLGTSNRRGGRT